MSNCKSCRAPIVWAVFESGKRVPLDPIDRDDGNIVVLVRSDGSPPLVRVVPKPEQDELVPRKRYVSHFVTCSDADSHRRR